MHNGTFFTDVAAILVLSDSAKKNSPLLKLNENRISKSNVLIFSTKQNYLINAMKNYYINARKNSYNAIKISFNEKKVDQK